MSCRYQRKQGIGGIEKIYKLNASNLSINGFPIRDFSAEFENILLVKGRIGSGKTLLLKALAGVYKTDGELNLTSDDPLKGGELLEDGYFVHSQPEFNFVAGNIEDEAAFAGIDPDFFKGYDNRPLRHFSGGELKKLSVLMALKSRYELLLLDEPLDMLDDEEQDNILKYIVDASREKSVIIATHSNCFDEAADCIICLESLPNSLFKPGKIPDTGDEALAIPSLSLSLRFGEIGAIFGKNASGKTRILRRLIGLKSWGDEFDCRINSSEEGVCLQFPENMLWQESIKEVIADIAGNAYIKPVLEKLGWEKRAEENPLFLSEGEKRILILISNLLSKKVLIFDEPFASLDTASAEQIKTAFYEAALNGGAVLYTANKKADLYLSRTPLEKIFKVINL
ncbi:MAG: ATP-binding cassette domain-containing protein [Deferribacteraceae bacterium]|jgi:energy-coupling factor transporter ATP-binding protein EcfA2|nr:ATP-binding cassette domain-containing protein [Deferribacteraceae bacterium]